MAGDEGLRTPGRDHGWWSGIALAIASKLAERVCQIVLAGQH